MKKNPFTKTQLSGLLAICTVASALTPSLALGRTIQHGPRHAPPPPPPAVVEPIGAVAPPVYGPGASYSEQAALAELIGLCDNSTSIISQALAQANMAANYSFDQAARIIANAIHQAANYPQFNVGARHFHYITAVRAAAEVSAALMNSTAASNTLTPELKAQIRYGFLSELAEIVLSAHEELDVAFVQPVYQECGYGCFGQQDLPREYYDGVAKLAKNFMDLMTNNSEGTEERAMMGSVRVELPVTKAVVHASKIILLNSRLRESYASRIYQLNNLELTIGQMLSPGGYVDINPQEARAIVRSQFDCIEIYPYVY